MSDNEAKQTTKRRVQINVYASKLKNVAGFGKGTSDPYAVVTLLAGGPNEKPQILGKTEVIKNNLNPAWTTSFTTDYEFGQETKFNVGIFDSVRKAKRHKAMGSALFDIGDVLGSRGNIKAKKLRDGGTVFVRVAQASEVDYGTLHLKLRGLKLKNVDGMFSKSDPFFVIQTQTNSAGGKTWIPVYRSERIDNNLHPQWKPTQLSMEELCGGDRRRPIQVEVFDYEKNGKHKHMGKFETTVDGLLNGITTINIGKKPPKPMPTLDHEFVLLEKGKKFGSIIVTEARVMGAEGTPENQSNSSASVTTTTTVTYIEPSHEQTPLNTMPADFGSVLDEPIPVAPAVLVPNATDSTAGANVPAPLPVPMAPPPMPQRDFTRVQPTFVDYISGGCEINMFVAIDFTGSNGDPRRPGTLHHINRDGVSLNDYEKAITAVGSVIARYDSDQKFPVWGFGAKYGGHIQHCFQVGTSSELDGVGGILEGYRATFQTGLTMSGPTVFGEVIATAAQMARSRQREQKQIGKQSYGILVILTDGAVTDIQATKMALQQAADAPLSIVIIGIGNEDFSRMQFLDDFQQRESSPFNRGRDIVQFVEFSRFENNRRGLTRETLDEIPDQLVGYFTSNGIMPHPPVSGSKANVYEEDYNAEEDIDLSYDLNAEGEISLENDQQATFDAQGYGTYQSFLPPPMAPPSTANIPPPSAPALSSSAPSGPYVPPSANSGGNPAAPPVVATAMTYMVNIQAPQNSYPGMQLQVQNPNTGNFQVVVVPEGVQPGQTFAVALS